MPYFVTMQHHSFAMTIRLTRYVRLIIPRMITRMNATPPLPSADKPLLRATVARTRQSNFAGLLRGRGCLAHFALMTPTLTLVVNQHV